MQRVSLMKSDKTMKRALEILAMMMIGDGVLAAFGPRRHVTLWRGRARGSGWNRMLTWFAEHRKGTRVIGAVEIVAGLALARGQSWRASHA
jgi:hypothetical protein